MSEINVTTIKNENGDYGPSLVGHSTVTGDLTVTGELTVATLGPDVSIAGSVTANKFYGDGAELQNLPESAGLGTVLSDDKTSPLNKIYYTDQVLSVGSTITIDPPNSSQVAYTQYSQIVLNDGADLIVSAGDDFIPDILGIGTTGVGSGTLTGDGGRIRADNLTNRAGTGAPTANNGLVVTGVATATSFIGNLTGNATGTAGGLAGTPDIAIRNITGTAATFSGNVSIGGTLTYEDVTNVDSVGMVTARKGIQVLSDGINAVGVVTATGFSGDGSNLSGIESGVANFVASGTIPDGAPVVLNSDGTVSVITSSVSSTPYASVNQTFNDAAIEYPSCAYDSANGKVIIAYTDRGNSYHGTAVVGTVSGTSISFGPRIVFKSGDTSRVTVVHDSTNNKIVIGYRDGSNSNYGTAIVGTVDATNNSISFGSPVQFTSDTYNYSSCVYDSANGKVVFAYRDGGGSNGGKARVGTVSGTSISFGSEATFNSSSTSYIASTFDSNSNKVVISFAEDDSPSHAKSIVGTVSGTSISFGSPVTLRNVSGTNWIASTFDSNSNKVVIAYRDTGNSQFGTAVVGTVSGTSISFGTATVFESGDVSHKALTFDSTNNKIVIAYRDSGNSDYGTAVVGTVSGTSISFGNSFVINGQSTTYFSAAYDPGAQQTVIAYYNAATNNQSGSVVVLTSMLRSSNLSTGNYIGIAAEAISSGATGKINIVGGTNTGQTGLTIGKTYYVRSNGDGINLGATDPVVVAGTAISATKILVR